MATNISRTCSLNYTNHSKWSLPDEILLNVTDVFGKSDTNRASIANSRLVCKAWSKVCCESVRRLNVDSSNLSYLKRFTKIESLNLTLSPCARLSSDVSSLLELLSYLKKLTISELRPHELQYLLPYNRSEQLTHFEFNFVDDYPEAVELSSLKQFKNLTHIYSPSRRSYFDWGSSDGISNLKKLKSLKLNDYCNITADAIEKISTLGLETLEFTCCSFVSNRRSYKFPTSLQSLEMAHSQAEHKLLNLWEIGLESDVIPIEFNLDELSELKHLCLVEKRASKSIFEKMGHLQKLTELFVAGALVDRALKEITLRFGTPLSSLKSIELQGKFCAVFNDPFDQPLSRLTRLTRLSLQSELECSGPTSNPEESQFFAFSNLRQLRCARTLRHLHIRSKGDCGEKNTNFLTQFNQLEVLGLSGNSASSAISEATLSVMTKLMSLDLSCTEANDASVDALKRLPNLRNLSLSDCYSISRSAWCGISQMTLLTNLDVGKKIHSNTRSMSFDDTAVSQWSQLGNLGELNLEGNSNLTGGCLAAIATLNNLRDLSLKGCLGIDRLRGKNFSQIGKLHSLTRLDLSMTKIRTVDLLKYSGLSNLRGLGLNESENISEVATRQIHHISHIDALDFDGESLLFCD